MRKLVKVTAIVALAVAIAGCGASGLDESVKVQVTTAPVTSPTTARPPVTTTTQAAFTLADLKPIVVYLGALPKPTTTTVRKRIQPPPTWHKPTGGQVTNSNACGGNLPPCSVCQRESHCTYGIVSKHFGCSGYHCYGKWQFNPETWRKVVDSNGLNVPRWPLTDWSAVTPQQEDQVASALWNNGAGCSHWSAC